MGSLPNRRFKPWSRIVGQGAETFELTKIDVAEALIRTAVRLFFQDEHPVPIYQLASSAREILTTVGEKVGVETVLHAIAKKQNVPVKTLAGEAHKFAGRFKHADRNPTEKIQFRETDVDWVLLLACHDFGRVTGGMPVEAQVFEAWAHLVFWERISDAPLRQQRVLRLAIKEFPGVRTATRAKQKKIGLETLRRVENDPKLQMRIEREVRLAAKE
jgi:hypothetical protein